MLGTRFNRSLSGNAELVNASHQALRVGLTGGIGCGKTRVCDLFAERGIAIIDADIIAREIVQPNRSAYEEIIASFGEALIATDGQLDRRLLRERVFAQPEELLKLEKITHPRIISRMRELVLQSSSAYCILCIPLLFEKKLEAEVDRVLVVDSSIEMQKQRVSKRDQSSPEQVEAIMQQQISRQQRCALADDLIDNQGTLVQLNDQVQALHEKYLQLV